MAFASDHPTIIVQGNSTVFAYLRSTASSIGLLCNSVSWWLWVLEGIARPMVRISVTMRTDILKAGAASRRVGLDTFRRGLCKRSRKLRLTRTSTFSNKPFEVLDSVFPSS